MCKTNNALVAVLQTAESATINLLTVTNVIGTAEGQTIQKDFDAAIKDVQSWKPGNAGDEVVQVLTDLMDALPLIPLPAPYPAVIAVAIGTIAGIIKTIQGNAAPAVAAGVSAEEHGALHTARLVAATTQAVQAHVPGFKRNILMSPSDQFKQEWNQKVAENGLPETLKA